MNVPKTSVTTDAPVLLRERAKREIANAQTLFKLTRQDARIGYEASNHYYYYPLDLVEKVVNCSYIIEGTK